MLTDPECKCVCDARFEILSTAQLKLSGYMELAKSVKIALQRVRPSAVHSGPIEVQIVLQSQHGGQFKL